MSDNVLEINFPFDWVGIEKCNVSVGQRGHVSSTHTSFMASSETIILYWLYIIVGNHLGIHLFGMHAAII